MLLKIKANTDEIAKSLEVLIECITGYVINLCMFGGGTLELMGDPENTDWQANPSGARDAVGGGYEEGEGLRTGLS